MADNKEWIGMKEFAEMLGLSVKYAQQFVRERKGPKFYRFGREIRFRRSDVEAWIESCAVNPSGS